MLMCLKFIFFEEGGFFSCTLEWYLNIKWKDSKLTSWMEVQDSNLTFKVATEQFWYDLGSSQASYESNFTGCGCIFGTTWEILKSSKLQYGKFSLFGHAKICPKLQN